MGQLSHPYMATGKTIALTIRIFVSKVMSLLFNMLSRFVISFLPRSKSLLFFFFFEQESFNFMTVVHSNFGAQEKFCHCFHFFPSVFHEVMGLDALILVS
ncbi:unnamed protein product [Rangifer tarandus platyrhynchus]|uniref:Uncharacterized protein n=1 Tax=Rangifer tarandus platyrhynchus TaxID=3082113 RepID=A0ABN8XQP9_RANTA|nr:unnamed protein product [Rangifer tarandus platyrhynchus]